MPKKAHSPATTSDSEQPMNFERWLLLLLILCAPFLAVLDVFILNVAIPSIQHSLQATSATVQFVVVGYTLSYASLLVTGGRLGDLYGRRTMLVVGLSLFSLTSLFCAVAPNQAALVAARILQGAAAALMYPQTLSLIRLHFHGKDHTLALSAFGVALALAAVSGQVLGGVILDLNLLQLSWRMIFLINIPIGLAAAVLIARRLKDSKAAATPRIDMGGVALLTISLACLIFFLVMGRELGWPVWMWVLLGLSMASGAGFMWYERRLSGRGNLPLIHLDLLKMRGFLVGLVVTLVLYAGQGSFFLFLTLFLQHGLELSPLAAGLTFVPAALGLLIASSLSPKIIPRLGKYTLTLGAILAMVGVAGLSFTALHYGSSAPTVKLMLVLLIIGAGFGLIIPPLIGVALRSMPANHSGAASGMLVTTQQVASAIGIALIGIPFFNALSTAHPDYTHAFGHTMYYTAGLFAVTALLTTFLKD